MTKADARFEDGAERPIRLAAADAEDLAVISALVQDAVLPASEMTWDRARRRFALLLNRFRWEDRALAERTGRPAERVQSLLVIEDVTGVASQGLDRHQPGLVLSLLALDWEPGEDGQGHLVLTFAGDGAVRLSAECLDVVLRDVTLPYAAPSRRVPSHD